MLAIKFWEDQLIFLTSGQVSYLIKMSENLQEVSE